MPATLRPPTLRTDWLRRWAQYAPHRDALVDDATGRAYPYPLLDRMAARAAAFLRGRGVGAGDRVAVLALNHPAYVALFFACWRIGAVLVPVNTRLTAREVAHVVTDAGAALLLAEDAFAHADAGLDVPKEAFEAFAAHLDDETAPADEADADLPDDAPVMILYTAGTTGAPKGAVLTPRGITWNAINTALRLNLTEADVVPIFAPFFHTGGWHVLLTPVLHHGGTLVLLRRFDAPRILALCTEGRCTILFGVPTMMEMLRRDEAFAGANFSSCRYAIVGGEPMPLPLIQAWHARGVAIRQGYGLTEFGPNVFSLSERDAERKIGSIGLPNFYVDARVLRDDGTECAAGEVGELALAGPSACAGYWQNAAATAALFRDGYVLTGDLVRRDDEGYVYVVDRKKEMFISGAENVYPAEVEHHLRQMPGVRDVAVVGVPDAAWGEVGMAFVVPEPGAALAEDAVVAFGRTGLARYKVPKHVRFVDALPTSDAGKTLKRVLRDRARAEMASPPTA